MGSTQNQCDVLVRGTTDRLRHVDAADVALLLKDFKGYGDYENILSEMRKLILASDGSADGLSGENEQLSESDYSVCTQEVVVMWVVHVWWMWCC